MDTEAITTGVITGGAIMTTLGTGTGESVIIIIAGEVGVEEGGDQEQGQGLQGGIEAEAGDHSPSLLLPRIGLTPDLHEICERKVSLHMQGEMEQSLDIPPCDLYPEKKQ